jgi:hypothetical protein
MKKIQSKLLFFFALISLSSNIVKAEKQEFSKVIYKEFNIEPYGTTQLINKYGKIDAKTWDGSQVKIKVSIIANTNSQNEAEEIFNRIKIDFYNDSKFVKAETHIGESKSKWVNWSWGSSNSDYSINYEVYYPRGNFLDLSNKYGDSYIGFTNGAVKANIKYGNVRIEDVNNSVELLVAYGNSNIGNVKKDLKANIDYGKLIARSAEKIDINGDYSEFEIEYTGEIKTESDYATFRLGKVESLTGNADYGHFKIRSVGNINFNGDYTDVSIGSLENFADINMDYGSLKIDNVGKNFSEIRIDADYTDVVIAPESGCDYRLNASSNYAGIKYPAGFNVNYEKDGNTNEKVEGFMGAKNAKGFIKVNVSYGGLKIR